MLAKRNTQFLRISGVLAMAAKAQDVMDLVLFPKEPPSEDMRHPHVDYTDRRGKKFGDASMRSIMMLAAKVGKL